MSVSSLYIYAQVLTGTHGTEQEGDTNAKSSPLKVLCICDLFFSSFVVLHRLDFVTVCIKQLRFLYEFLLSSQSHKLFVGQFRQDCCRSSSKRPPLLERDRRRVRTEWTFGMILMIRGMGLSREVPEVVEEEEGVEDEEGGVGEWREVVEVDTEVEGAVLEGAEEVTERSREEGIEGERNTGLQEQSQ